MFDVTERPAVADRGTAAGASTERSRHAGEVERLRFQTRTDRAALISFVFTWFGIGLVAVAILVGLLTVLG